MSNLQKFLFEGRPVRGAIVRLDDVWLEIQQRRAASGAFAPVVNELLGEMSAAALLLQASIKFNGAVVLQIQGDGPLKLAVAEAQPDWGVRCTATLTGEPSEGAAWNDWVNATGKGICALTLDPKDRLPGQTPYQGLVPMVDEHGAPLKNFSQAISTYMKQSEQLDTLMLLAANEHCAFGLMLQHMPATGEHNLAATSATRADSDGMGANDAFEHLAMLAMSLQREEMLQLDTDTLLRRLFWQEPLVRLPAMDAGVALQPHFACRCSRERVSGMLVNLGAEEVQSVVAEQGHVNVTCEFCGQPYVFDAVDAAALFQPNLTPHISSGGKPQQLH